MKKITQIAIVVALASFMAACGNSSKKEGNAAINDKKVELERLKTEQTKNDEKIGLLQEELSKLDSNADNSKIKLVAVSPVGKDDFKHYIDLQGKIDAENIYRLENYIYLQVIDRSWKNHLLSMDHLKDSVSLRGYGQRDPLQEYSRTGFVTPADSVRSRRSWIREHRRNNRGTRVWGETFTVT